MKKRNGFTLVELLAIIVVIAIIAVIVTVAYNQIVNGNKQKLNIALKKNIEDAAASYCAKFACFDNDGKHDSQINMSLLTGTAPDTLPLLEKDELKNHLTGKAIADCAKIDIHRDDLETYSYDYNFDIDKDTNYGSC